MYRSLQLNQLLGKLRAKDSSRWLSSLAQTPKVPSGSQSAIVEARIALFSKGVESVSAHDYDKFIERWIPNADVTGISNFIRLGGMKQGQPIEHYRRNLPVLASRIKLLTRSKWQSKQYSFVIFGLWYLEEVDNGFESIISSMTVVLQNALENNQTPLQIDVSMILQGFHSNRCNSATSKHFLTVLAKLMGRCKDAPTPKSICNALPSLIKMTSDSPEVRILLISITKMIESCEESFSRKDVSRSLYSLHGMKNDNPEVRAMVAALSTLR